MGRVKNKTKSSRTILNLGSIRIVRKGIPAFHWDDLYHILFTLSLSKLLGLLGVTYLAINTLFAFAYLLGESGIENAHPNSFADAFFFSIQTFATIGYGAMYPRTAYINILVVVEVFIGLLGMAMATGLMFARFSMPTARILFSNVAVICPYNGMPMLMFRTANQRSNLIVEAEVNVNLLLPETTPEGHSLRRLYPLKLVRSNTPTFVLSWTIMHPLDETSPLYGRTLESLIADNAQIIVTFNGLDETVKQTMHARHVYLARDILENRRFVDVVTFKGDNDRAIDYEHFHDVVPLQNVEELGGLSG
ncbi:ion channel [Lusitaniella coriacea]|uniref:ion channel n=1 Tax=Lusitaniella coriacea TaxID=1983105 RepID=UPI003CE8B24D